MWSFEYGDLVLFPFCDDAANVGHLYPISYHPWGPRAVLCYYPVDRVLDGVDH